MLPCPVLYYASIEWCYSSKSSPARDALRRNLCPLRLWIPHQVRNDKSSRVLIENLQYFILLIGFLPSSHSIIDMNLSRMGIRLTPVIKTRFLFELLLLNPLNCNALYGKGLWGYFINLKKAIFPSSKPKSHFTLAI